MFCRGLIVWGEHTIEVYEDIMDQIILHMLRARVTQLDWLEFKVVALILEQGILLCGGSNSKYEAGD